MMEGVVSPAERDAFERDGERLPYALRCFPSWSIARPRLSGRALLAAFLLRRRLFDAEEIALLSAIGKWREPEGGIWVKPPGDPAAPTIYDAIYRDRRVLEPMAALLCDELCDFNYKMITKQKSIAGSKRGEGGSGNHWVWHQVRLHPREHPGAALTLCVGVHRHCDGRTGSVHFRCSV